MKGKSTEQLLKWMDIVRRDIGSLVVHWTRSKYDLDAPKSEPPQQDALKVLTKILDEGMLRGSDSFIKGGYKCICFTEAPISEIAPLFKTFKVLENQRYEPFGIAVDKKWLFQKGGRPVIYQSDAEFDLLPETMKWKHSLYEPGEIDFTWEREWRVHTESLKLDPARTMVIVPNHQYAFDLMNRYKTKSGPSRWIVIPLDHFGL